MIKPFEELIIRLGLKPGGGLHTYTLEAGLHTALMELAEQEHRPAQEVQAELLATALQQRKTNVEMTRRWKALSPREQEVSALACLGYTNRQIAGRLGVSEETVKSHVRNALVKFNLHGKSELRMALGEWDFSEWD